MHNRLHIAHISSECAPFAKTGGLGDVVRELPSALAKLDNKVCVLVPFHGKIAKEKLSLKTIFKDIPIRVCGKIYKSDLLMLKRKAQPTLFFISNKELFTNKSPIYFLKRDGLRFLFFDIAALTFLNMLIEQRIPPFEAGIIDIIHCHDWHSGLIPQLLRKRNKTFQFISHAATIYTIHNLAFQGQTDWWAIPTAKRDNGTDDPEKNMNKVKHLNFTKRAILHADIVNTVSERYAFEILTHEFGQGLEKILQANKSKVFGIINGIDYSVWNPKFDPGVYKHYDSNSISKKAENKKRLQKELGLEINPNVALIGMASRLTEQKGFDLIMKIIDDLLVLPLQLVVVGSGDKEYMQFFKEMSRRHPTKIGAYSFFSESMASKVYAASDMYLMPSRFEPCGISQLISLRYGAVPIVHSTGGLHDTVTDIKQGEESNGFVFMNYLPNELLTAILRALVIYKEPTVWEELMLRGMRQSFSWDLPAKKYLHLYRLGIKKRHKKLKHVLV